MDLTNTIVIHFFPKVVIYKPNWANNAIENYLFSTRIELEKIQIKSFKDNLPKHERKALQSLRSNDRIIIKKADKNSSTVVLDKELYIKMANDQLNDNVHYERINESHTTEILDSINTIIHRLHNESYIDEVTFKFLINDQGKRLGRLYFLPKLHKINQSDREKIKTDINHLQNVNVPGRPIVYLCNSPLEKIAQYIDYFIKPVVNKFWTYTQDTTSFINKLEKIRAPADILMSSFDISSMYTNLHHTEIINAIDRAWPLIMQCKFDIPVPPKKALLELLRISLANNEFEFNGQIFQTESWGSNGIPNVAKFNRYKNI
ncbi:peptide-methionine (R)-S-oxide reductase [Mytilus galloprovincialis]|uniref:Peptide-methionine (R)-S-oxide reductase n=1 Tax=Mytilus galloprovincialis TaxID=29158 RepID=A0A8B6D398_MYTGA|nr:peptide-methionine (R)-S-oxide reductase [Mytilus galloprovincialis]